MGALTQQLTDAFGGFMGSGTVQLTLRLVLGYILIVWLASAYWAFRDMQSRSDHPSMPYFAGALVILFSPLLFPLGLIVYRIVRPSERVVDRRERALSESVLLAEAGEIEQCAGCHRIVQPEWVSCPTCRTELREHCRECNRLVEFDWVSCAWCGNDLNRVPQRFEPGQREPVPVMDEDQAHEPAWPGGGSPQVAMALGRDGRSKARAK